ncbi:MAG: HAD-IIB family hydrolase [Limnothrix sp. RL_2_0]|nr:HAD-IIB family hydrolase [Limnothrix sp. RL_2_0]
MQKLLVCTDLDRTLIPNGQLLESPNARSFFRRFVAHSVVSLVYVTGRHLALVEQAIADYDLPVPDFVIPDVGASIYENQGQHWHRWQSWDDRLAKDWGQKTAADVAALLQDIADCRLQEPEKQGLHKLSYYVELDIEAIAVIEQVKTRLSAAGLQANYIWSIDEEAQVGLLDILPQNANKYEAIAFLMNEQDFSTANTVFSGDSGNDRDVLISPIRSILVANANTDLKQQIQATVEKAKTTDTFYLAKGNFLGMNGNYSAGILEGIIHYFPQTKTWLSC